MPITKRHTGFSLAELVIVLAVVGVLATIVIASTAAARATARDGRRQSDLKQIQLGLAVYYDVNRQYPAALSTLADPSQKYLPAVPVDPQNGASYEYALGSGGTTYCLGATLENTGSIPTDNASCSTGGTANYKVQQPQ